MRRHLDLFARAQGTSVGYARGLGPGWETTASDIDEYAKHPEVAHWITADAFDLLDDADFIRSFDLVTGSPVCKGYSDLSFRHQGKTYPQQIEPFVMRLEELGVPYIVENVDSGKVKEAYSLVAPGREWTKLCGSMFGLGADCRDGEWRQLQRHRLFLPSSGLTISAPNGCVHAAKVGGVYGTGGGGPQTRGYRFHWTIGVYGNGGSTPDQKGYAGDKAEAETAMGIDWMRRRDLSQAIPPVYTEWLGWLVAQQIL
jgi:DNA (cytosine-5)-methyltransferase 1